MDEDCSTSYKNNTDNGVKRSQESRGSADTNKNEVRESDVYMLSNKTAIFGSTSCETVKFNNNSIDLCHEVNSSESCALTSVKMSGKCFPISKERNINNSHVEEVPRANRSNSRLISPCDLQQQSYEDNTDYACNVKINNTDIISMEKSHSNSNLNNIESEIVCVNKPGKNVGMKVLETDIKNQSEYNINVPSTSRLNGHCSSESSLDKEDHEELKEDVMTKPNRKRPNHSRKKKTNVKEFDSSSDTGNDDYSLGSEDGCIYTYRGGEHLADLPSSFFSLDMGLTVDNSHLPAPPLFGVRPEPIADERQARASGASSPDMDYLEMDFDPGPSCELDTNDESSLDLDLDAVPAQRRIIPEEELLRENLVHSPLVNVKSPSNIELREPLENTVNETTSRPDEVYNIHDVSINQPSTSKQCLSNMSNVKDQSALDKCVNGATFENVPVYSLKGSLIPHTSVTGEVIYVRRTGFSWPSQWEVHYHHNTTGDLVSPSEICDGEVLESAGVWSYPNHIGKNLSTSDLVNTLDVNRVNLSSALFHCTMAKKLVVEKQNATFLEDPDNSNVDGPCVEECGAPAPVPRSMIWSETEACARQITQLGTSACGATAVVNTLMALEQPIDMDAIAAGVGTRQRAPPEASLPRYLLSRAVAGCTAGAPGMGGLRGGIHAATDGKVTTRFFPTWPERCFSLSHWLAYWITLGAVPIATLNLQGTVIDPAKIPDSWHHQMIFGVSPRGVFLSNPLECISEGALWGGLCSDSILLVRRRDVLSRWTSSTDLTPLMTVPGDVRWTTMNVIGQVVSMIREDGSIFAGSRSLNAHLKIPASYKAGITVAARTGSEAHRRLVKAPELPLYIPDDNVK